MQQVKRAPSMSQVITCITHSNLSEADKKEAIRACNIRCDLLCALESLEIFMRDTSSEDADLDVWVEALDALKKARGAA